MFIGGGRHSSFEYGVEGRQVSVPVRTTNVVTDGDPAQGGLGLAWSQNSQPVVIAVELDWQISRAEEDLTYLWENRRQVLTDTAYVNGLIARTVAEQIKEVSVRYPLNDMIGVADLDGQLSTVGREQFVNAIVEQVKPELAKLRIDVLSMRVYNIDPADEEYEGLMNDANNAKARKKVAEEELNVKNAEREKAAIDNEIAIDKANADAEIRRINAQVYDNPLALEVELAKIWSDALNEGDVIVIVPEGADLSYILGSQVSGATSATK